ncbi:MAG: FHA domain-containing protein [Eubacterium sp.]|nr:FHA domain-containing protein [Eubacterium sp.]
MVILQKNKGISNVIEIREINDDTGYSFNMITKASFRYLPQASIGENGGALFYRVDGLSSLAKRFGRTLPVEKDLRMILRNLYECIIEVKNHLLDVDGLLIDMQHIFYDSEKKEYRFLYATERGDGFYRKLKRFLEDIMVIYDHDDKKGIVFLYNFYADILKDNFSPKMYCELVNRLIGDGWQEAGNKKVNYGREEDATAYDRDAETSSSVGERRIKQNHSSGSDAYPGMNIGAGTRMNIGAGTGMNIGAGSGMNAGAGMRMNTGAGMRMNAGAGTRMKTGTSSGMNAGIGAGMNTGTGTRMNDGTGTRMNAGAGKGISTGKGNGIYSGINSGINAIRGSGKKEDNRNLYSTIKDGNAQNPDLKKDIKTYIIIGMIIILLGVSGTLLIGTNILKLAATVFVLYVAFIIYRVIEGRQDEEDIAMAESGYLNNATNEDTAVQPVYYPTSYSDDSSGYRKTDNKKTEAGNMAEEGYGTVTRLVPIEAGKMEPIMIPEGEISIGRNGKENDYCIRESGVSRIHARIRRKGNRIEISDCDSTNGTYINSRRIMKGNSRRLKIGDTVSFAGVEFYCL